MKKLQPTTQFRRDLKRYKNKPRQLATLGEILSLLKNEQPIPAQHKPHELQGRYKGCMECHVQGDFLLVWIDESRDIIELIRLGSHSELFG